MKRLPFEKARFLSSELERNPELAPSKRVNLPEIAIVGRSNVGKSSLLNHLMRNRCLARVSSTPGKTQRINYFFVDELALLVDLPGDGYAELSRSTRRTWGPCLEGYFQIRPRFHLLLFLIDIRHLPSKGDIAFLRFASFHQIPLLLVLTKTDKLKQRERQKQAFAITDALKREASPLHWPTVHYSVKQGKCRRALIEMINGRIWG